MVFILFNIIFAKGKEEIRMRNYYVKLKHVAAPLLGAMFIFAGDITINTQPQQPQSLGESLKELERSFRELRDLFR